MSEALLVLRQSGSPERLRPDSLNASLAEQIEEECRQHQSVAELAQERALHVVDLEAKLKEADETMVDAQQQLEKLGEDVERHRFEVRQVTEQGERDLAALHESHKVEVNQEERY